MLALLLEFCLIHCAATREVFLEQAVHHHVGIATYRRGEVGVIVECKAVVPDIDGRVDGFSHGTHGKRGEQVLFSLALDVV